MLHSSPGRRNEVEHDVDPPSPIGAQDLFDCVISGQHRVSRPKLGREVKPGWVRVDAYHLAR